MEKIRPDDSNRIARELRYAGGKGIDVSRVLTTLGVVNRALGLVGGFAGEELEGRLLNERIATGSTNKHPLNRLHSCNFYFTVFKMTENNFQRGLN